MEIDAKGVGVFIWKILRLSTNTTCRYMRKYPVVSGVSTFVFLLYAFLPSGFYFLLCSSPLIAFAAFYLRNHLSLKPLEIGNSSKEKKTDDGSSSSVQKGSVSGDVRNQKAYLRPQRSVRRNARRKVEEVGKDWDSLHASEDETDRVILTTLYGELPSTRGPDFKKFKKDKTLLTAEESLFDHVVDSFSSNTENVVLDSSEKVTSGGGETEMVSSSSEEEESHDERNKAVAWTEDDQKNLMDLGISEIERNKRLENLIARRRVRRLFLLAAERSLRGMGIPPICVERNYFGLDQDNYDIDGLQMPGSAPSVLLATRNPFDLPYDPQEEKPNLSGDSFQQEFAVGYQKDMLFCRHESFCRGIFSSENQQDSKLELWRKVGDVQGFSRLKPPQDGGNNDRLVEQRQPLAEANDLTRAEGNNMGSGSAHISEVHIETGSMRNDDSDSSSSLSPRENLDVPNQTNRKTFSKRRGDHIGNSPVGLVPRNNNSSSLGAERQRYMEHFGYRTSRRHMVTHSADSDLQVEVSEIGSPPTTVDENDYSDDEKSLFVYESDKVGKEMGFSEKTETKPENTADTLAKFELLPVEKGDRDFTKNGLSISPEDNVTKKFEGPSDVKDVHDGSLEDDGPKPRELEGQSPSVSSNVIPLEISERESHISEELAAPHPDEVVSEIEESHKLSENLADEIKISYDSDEAEPSEKTDQDYQDQGENNDEEQPAREMQEVAETEASDVDHGNPYESPPSPRSVLPDVLSLHQTYSLNSEDLENLSDGRPRTVNADPESLQNQSAGGRNTEEPEEFSVPSEISTEETTTVENSNLDAQETIQKKQEDSAVTVSEESRLATGIDDTAKLHNENSKSTESREEPKQVKHENLDFSEQIISRDEPETVRDVQEENKTAQALQSFADPSAEELKNDESTVIEERNYASNTEDGEHRLEDRSQSRKAAPESFQSQSTGERNIEEPEEQSGPSEKSTEDTDIVQNVNPDALGSIEKKHEGSSITLSEECRVDDPVINENLYKDASKYTQSSADQVKFQTKGITETEESELEKHESTMDLSQQIRAGEEPETVRDVHHESNKTAEGHDSFVDPSGEELKNDQRS